MNFYLLEGDPDGDEDIVEGVEGEVTSYPTQGLGRERPCWVWPKREEITNTPRRAGWLWMQMKLLWRVCASTKAVFPFDHLDLVSDNIFTDLQDVRNNSNLSIQSMTKNLFGVWITLQLYFYQMTFRIGLTKGSQYIDIMSDANNHQPLDLVSKQFRIGPIWTTGLYNFSSDSQ